MALTFCFHTSHLLVGFLARLRRNLRHFLGFTPQRHVMRQSSLEGRLPRISSLAVVQMLLRSWRVLKPLCLPLKPASLSNAQPSASLRTCDDGGQKVLCAQRIVDGQNGCHDGSGVGKRPLMRAME